MFRLTAFALLATALLRAQAPATGSFDFRVATTTNKPVTGASVTIQGPDGKSYTGVTAADGHFRLTNLSPGVYNFREFDAPGYVRAPKSFLTEFSIHAGNTGVFSLDLIPSEKVQGTVTDEDGKPIEGATVVALGSTTQRASERRIFATASTDARGFYWLSLRADPASFFVASTVISSLPSLTVKAFVPRERVLQTGQAYYPDFRDSGQTGPAVQRSNKTETIDISLRRTPTFHVKGRVASTPATAEAPTVWISDCSAAQEETLNTSVALRNDGTFDAAGILPGFYCVEFEITEKSTQAKLRSRAQLVTVSDRDIDQVDLATPLPGLR